MTFKEKIDKILTIKGIKLYKLAEMSGLGNTLEKAYEKDREMRTSTTERFIQKMGINSVWWEQQKGEVFSKNGTEVKESTDNSIMEDPEEVYRKLVEGNTEYVLIPRSVLQEKYRLVSLEQFQKDKEQMEKDKKESENQQKIIDKLLDQYDKVIARLTVLDPKLSGVQKSKQNS
jgi:hypothetical protein